ncbi:MAG: DMT family transporter [Muribaculaceae bacterium]|nr:DMT family transporter [Muribaculaceae bacterium]
MKGWTQISKGKFGGYIIGAIAGASYGLNPAFAIPLMREGMDVRSVLLFRYSISLPFILLLILWRGIAIFPDFRRVFCAMIVGVLMVLSSITLFESYNQISVGIASSLLFLYPLFVALIMALFFREKLRPATVASLLGAIAGVYMLCVPDRGTVVSWFGVALVVASALLYALYIIYVNREPLRSMSSLALTFWVLLSGSLVLAVVSFSRTLPGLPANAGGWVNLVLLALLPTLLSLLCTNAAIDRIGPTPAAILGVFEPATAVLIGMFLFHERMSVMQWSGLVVIFITVCMVIAGGRSERQ